MLTLQQLLESDSISSMIEKLNNNFQSLALNGGGPQGIPGEQGIPGLPGRMGSIGPTGPQGETGTVVGIIPFGTTAGGSTGPTGSAGPWNTNSYLYLQNVVGTGSNVVGQIWIDHWNQGFWKFLNTIDAVTAYTNSPYANVAGPGVPPTGTGYYGGTGWYFYPLNVTNGGGAAGDVWINDVTTYQTTPPFSVGPTSTGSPLTVKNARLVSKYGTVWISSGNAIDGSGNDDNNVLDTPTLFNWGVNAAGGYPQPSRYNSGVDRLYFKQSIDTLPFVSNVTARNYTAASGAPASNPVEESTTIPDWNGTSLLNWQYWVKPLYDKSLDNFSPLQYYTERRVDLTNYSSTTEFGSLGLYMYSSIGSYIGPGSISYPKSLFVYSTRTSINPDDNTTPTIINPSNTFNIGEMLLDVKRLTASNQFVCSTPQDLYGSGDQIDSGSFYDDYTVTQGYISTINGKSLTGDPDDINILNYGYLTDTPPTGVDTYGNYTRTSWYGSAAMATPNNWSDQLDSGDPGNTNPHTADALYRIAGMKERGRKMWQGPNANATLLDELIFYTSVFQNVEHDVNSQNLDFTANDINSKPHFYASAYRNFGIGTFTRNEVGVYEPAARLHVNAFLRAGDIDAGNIAPTVGGLTGGYTGYPGKIFRAAAFTSETPTSGATATYTDVYLGRTLPPIVELANPAASSKSNTTTDKYFDVAIRREGWVPTSSSAEVSILRLGVIPIRHSASANGTYIGTTASRIASEFSFAISPLNGSSTSTYPLTTPNGIGLHNLYPRARVHLFGKNYNNESKYGSDPYSPGFAILKGQTPGTAYPFYPVPERSNTNIVLDYVGSYYHIPAGIYEYPYEVFNLPNGTAIQGATGGSGSPNAANFPNREKLGPTRSVTPWTFADRNYGYPSTTGAVNGKYKHGDVFDAVGPYGNAFSLNNYAGFNLFRDLLDTGDDADASKWRLGSNGWSSGGGAILMSESGDFAFTQIPAARDGGYQAGEWEQTGLSTRDVLNNITMLINNRGDIGVGGRPGLDTDAYASMERNIGSGYVNYVNAASVADARTSAPGIALTFGGSNQPKPYGFASYIGLTSAYVESGTTSSAAAINANATTYETIRMEVAAEKVYGKNSRSTLKAGYGYPASQTRTLAGTSLRNYLILDWAAYTAAGGVIDNIQLLTDFEGRIRNIQLTRSSGVFLDITPYYKAFILPHPTEFNATSGTPWATAGFTAPVGAHAPQIKPISEWSYTSPVSSYEHQKSIWYLDDGSFYNDYLSRANIRLNNFVAGEGMNVSQTPGQTAAAAAIKQARQSSPKIILSFLEADNTNIPGTKAISATSTLGSNRPLSGTAAYRKVNTVIASAQNESSLREYWIPKADNTGGTFMVWTDHYGSKEKNSGGFDTQISTSRFYVEEVVTLEFVPMYYTAGAVTGTTGASSDIYNLPPASTGKFAKDNLEYRVSTANAPMYVKYYNSGMGNEKYGITGTKNNEFTTSQYAKKAKVFGMPTYPSPTGVFGAVGGPDSVLSGLLTSFGTAGSTAASGTATIFKGITAATGSSGPQYASVLRNVDKYYSLKQSSNWDNNWYNQDGWTNDSSQFRFKRINSDFALIDFNLTINVNNPDLNTGVQSNTTDAQNTIDFGSPRFTQYIRLTYMPTAGSSDDNDYFMKLFGNSLSFMNWSSYNQWYPGTAISSDPSGNSNSSDSLSKTNGPGFNSGSIYSPTHTNNLTWTGNTIEATSKPFDYLGQEINANNNIFANSAVSYQGFSNNDISAMYGAHYFNSNLSRLLTNVQNSKSNIFSSYMGRAYSLFGNDYLSRVRNCTWRLVPRYGSYYGAGTGGASIGDYYLKNNSFTLEIMFDKPILHVDTPFRSYNFNAYANETLLSNPYQALTVSGQAIVRYSDSTQTYFDGGILTPTI